MGELIDLAARRQGVEEERPHMCGPVKCLACQHRWEGICPVGTTDLTCPKCEAERGVFMGPMVPSGRMVWQCCCGCDVFHLTPAGPFCLGCGSTSDDWAK